MRRFTRIFQPVAVLAALLLPAACAAAQCPIPREIVTASRSLSDAERETINKCVESQAVLIESGPPVEVSRGRMELTQAPRSPGASEIFRRAYADAVRDRLRAIIKNGDEFRAVNALTIYPFLLTAESLDELAENAAPVRQPRQSLRIAAARLLAQACRSLNDSNASYSLNPAQSDALSRKIREAAMTETSWVALAELASALLRQSSWRMPAINQDTVRMDLLRVLQRQVDLAKTSPETLRAVHPTLVGIRKQIIELPAAARPDYALQLNPILKSIKSIADKPPAGANESLKRVYEQCGSLVDQILGLFR